MKKKIGYIVYNNEKIKISIYKLSKHDSEVLEERKYTMYAVDDYTSLEDFFFGKDYYGKDQVSIEKISFPDSHPLYLVKTRISTYYSANMYIDLKFHKALFIQNFHRYSVY